MTDTFHFTRTDNVYVEHEVHRGKIRDPYTDAALGRKGVSILKLRQDPASEWQTRNNIGERFFWNAQHALFKGSFSQRNAPIHDLRAHLASERDRIVGNVNDCDDFEPVSLETWNRMSALVQAIVSDFMKTHDATDLDLPIFSAGEEGGIDVQWRGETRNLLIAVEVDAAEPTRFHAYDWAKDNHAIRGSLDETVNNGWLISWLLA